MRKINDGGPAFPVDAFNNEGGEYIRAGGMTLRDYFAAKAMQGFAADPKMDELKADEIAELAYVWSDAMLKAREQS